MYLVILMLFKKKKYFDVGKSLVTFPYAQAKSNRFS